VRIATVAIPIYEKALEKTTNGDNKKTITTTHEAARAAVKAAGAASQPAPARK
jgi:hypothetical protein